MPFSICREIGIDAGHRVPTHGSKCANLHGHRYKIVAECTSTELHDSGEQSDMVLDFGFLKEVMMDRIDKFCDHGMILWCKDPYFGILAGLRVASSAIAEHILSGRVPYWFDEGNRGNPTKLLIVGFIPTAERLAEFWFNQMSGDVEILSNGLATLSKVSVHETPQCVAHYPA